MNQILVDLSAESDGLFHQLAWIMFKLSISDHADVCDGWIVFPARLHRVEASSCSLLDGGSPLDEAVQLMFGMFNAAAPIHPC